MYSLHSIVNNTTRDVSIYNYQLKDFVGQVSIFLGKRHKRVAQISAFCVASFFFSFENLSQYRTQSHNKKYLITRFCITVNCTRDRSKFVILFWYWLVPTVFQRLPIIWSCLFGFCMCSLFVSWSIFILVSRVNELETGFFVYLLFISARHVGVICVSCSFCKRVFFPVQDDIQGAM